MPTLRTFTTKKRGMRIFISLLLISGTLIWTNASEAACSGGSPYRSAASPSQTDVSDCIAAAADGDTINIPPGDASWSAGIGISKSLTLQGANVIALNGAAGGTNISASGNCVWISLNKVIRVTGINFNGCGFKGSGIPSASNASFRVDHNSFYSASNITELDVMSNEAAASWYHPTGLYDHNMLHNYRILTRGTAALRTENDAQDQLWAQDPPFGSGDHVVYAEDNTITGSVLINWMDGNYGARYVGRFNTIGSGGGYFEVHSVQGNNRAVQMWELYHNTMMTTGNTAFGLGFIRGGSGYIFGNRVPTGTTQLRFNNVRSNTGCVADGSCQTSGPCDGTSAWDQNTTNMTGYTCRDQLGRAKDITKWTTGAAYAQDLRPIYAWDNLFNDGTQYVPALHDGLSGTSYVATHLRQNRDWYTQNTSFSGTTGVGLGPIASRPASCTIGVGYWATDEGEWNSLQAGPDGQLYKCIASNTWALYYKPLIYPHPLQTVGNAGASSSPTPTNLQVK